MNAKLVLAGITTAMLLSTGCVDRKSAGLYLPKGNAERGKAAFVQLQCNSCHQVSGVNLPVPAPFNRTLLTLGGEVPRLRTAGELVTAIIHPSRDISDLAPTDPARLGGPMVMKTRNEEMTVAQLVDLVTFLQPAYRPVLPGPDTSLWATVQF